MYPKIYTRNYLDKFSDGACTSGSALAYKMNDNRPESYWQSFGETDEDNDYSCQIIRNIKDSDGNAFGFEVDTVALIGINLEKFKVYYYDGSSYINPAAWIFTDNAETNLFLTLSSAVTIYGIKIEMDTTITANEEKQIAEIYVGKYQYEIAAIWSGGLTIEPRDNRQQVVMADGSLQTWIVRNSKRFEFKQSLSEVTRANRDILATVLDNNTEIAYRPDGDEYPDLIVSGMFSGTLKEHYNYKGDYYDIELEFRGT